MSDSPIWVDSTELADEAIHEITSHAYAGLDSEFYGCDITKESPVRRSVAHVFSLATPSGPLNPRGYHEVKSWVFAGSLLTCPSVKGWLEDARYIKAVHNQPVDHHTLRNGGVRLRGARNTLAMARFWYPDRVKRAGFGLDSLGEDFCGGGKTESYDDLLGYDAVEYRDVEREKRRCECGALSCLKRSDGHRSKTPERVIINAPFKVRWHLELESLSPLHSLWTRYLLYSARDAVLALWIYELMLRDRRERPYPWITTL